MEDGGWVSEGRLERGVLSGYNYIGLFLDAWIEGKRWGLGSGNWKWRDGVFMNGLKILDFL